VDPAFGLPAVWIREEDRDRAYRAEGYTVVDPPTIIATHLTQIIRSHAAEILGRKEVKELIDMTEKTNKVVADEVSKLGLGTIHKVLQGLLREQVSIRNTVLIFETLSDYGGVTKVPHILVEKVRQALGRQIALQYADEEKVLKVFTVAPDFLAHLLANRMETDSGPVAALELPLQLAWISALSASVAKYKDTPLQPVILSPAETRYLLKSSTERDMPNLVVLSILEIPKDIKTEPLGEIHVKQP
jgi:flagellar biosynthesis protein FlhA